MINIEKYCLTMTSIKKMYLEGKISEKYYIKIEQKIADKYCIKDGALYRYNFLINNDFRVINSTERMEVNDARKTDKNNRCITKIEGKTESGSIC